ncbi:MAG: lysine decarboxylase, partial [Carnobacterium sp.]|nr:lysine decarboxylase [Carnobacterium sp.]
YLHIGKGSSIEFQREIEHYLHILQSSSPSYLLMMSLEYARYFLANWTLDDLKQTLAYVTFWENKLEQAGFDVLKTADPLKLNIRKTGYLGEELAIYFEEKGLFPELSTESFILLTFPLLKAQQPIQLPEVDLEQLESREVVEKKRPIVRYPQMATLALSYEQQKMKAVEFVDLEQAIGRISAVMVTPYPPGIPLILKGEEIKQEQLAVLKAGLAQFNRIVGLKNQNEILVFSH